MTLVLLPVLALCAAAPWWVRDLPPPRRRRRAVGTDLDPAVLLDLAAAAVQAGVSLPAALKALGEATGGPVGEALHHTGTLLLLGATWTEAWSGAPAATAPLADALQPAWEEGVNPAPLLAGAARQLRADRGRAAREAAARLGARLVLPLGLCFLPAFILLGLVPVLLSTGGDLLHP